MEQENLTIEKSHNPPMRSGVRSRALIAKHERLQADAKRARGMASPWGLHPRAHKALGRFIRPAIPLAGCLTPRALHARRATFASGFEAR